LDFVAAGFDFVASGFDFVAGGFDFVGGRGEPAPVAGTPYRSARE
jgi:hypothetical protein